MAAAGLLAPLLVVLVGMGACGTQGGEAAAPPDPKVVEVTRIDAGTLRDTSIFGGQLSAEHSVVVKSETDGVVASIEFTEGERVTAGDVLFELRNAEQVARVREAEANLQLAQEVYARTRELVARKAVSLAQSDQAAAELGVARARVDLAQVELDRTSIRAPFDGVVSMSLVSPGDRVTDEKPLVQIDAVDRLQVIFALSELAVPFAKPGIPVEVMVAPYPGERFPGKVFYVSPTVDPASRRLLMKAWIPNQDGRLAAGLFAEVDVEVGRRENAIVIPESAVVFDRRGTYVWRVGDDSVVEKVPVETGLRSEGRVEVTLGLQSGDTIVTAGTHKVSDGDSVRAAEPVTRGQALRDEPDTGGGEEGT